MVHTKYNFKWFEKEDNRRAIRASISTDGKLRLGKPLCNVLPCTSHTCNDVQFPVRYPAFFDMSCEKTMLNSQIAVS